MKRLFSKEEHLEIAYACERIRILIFLTAGYHAGVSIDAKKVAQKSQKGSEINHLISQENWEELFGNEQWLSFLRDAENLSTIRNDMQEIRVHLRTIAEFFPEETAGYITFILFDKV